jgi:hypothetical protein
MQPTYLPWLGYFALMDQVDAFVFLDDVQFERRSWQQRNKVQTAQGPVTLTVPVLSKGRRDQKLYEVLIRPDSGFSRRHLRTISLSYARAPFCAGVLAGLTPKLSLEYERLCELNFCLIEWIRLELGVVTPCIRARDLDARGTRAERLVNICRALGADHYVSPQGARAYLEHDSSFDRAKISVSYQAYDHPSYSQIHGGFEECLSVLDLMMNVGPDSLAVIRKGNSHGSSPHN